MWKLKNPIWPNKKESLPTGKLNNQGHMVTDSEELKCLYLNEFKERLRNRPSHPDFVKIHKIKESIFHLGMEKARSNTTSDWTMKDLEKVLKEIKKDKSRDLLIMFNKLKTGRNYSYIHEKSYHFANS